MKKSAVLIFILALCILAGCKSTPTSAPSELTPNQVEEYSETITIKAVPINDEEYAILKAAGASNAMIFSVDNGHMKVQQLNCWVDRYENGRFVGQLMGLGSKLGPDDATSKIYVSITDINTEQELWTLAERHKGNISSGKIINTNMDFDSTAILPLNEITSLELDKSTDLGVLVRNKGKNGFTATPDVEQTIKENKEVYVLRCQFKAENL